MCELLWLLATAAKGAANNKPQQNILCIDFAHLLWANQGFRNWALLGVRCHG